MAGNTGSPGQSVAARTLAILGTFAPDRRVQTLTEMARNAGLPVPTALRLVRELEEWGALVRIPSGAFVLGRRLWDLGLLAPIQSGIRDAAAPFMQDLYTATLATTHLGLRDGTEVLYLERLSGRASVPVVSTVGSRLPLYSTGVGKVLLAHAPDEIRREVMRNLVPMTAHTIVAPGLLDRQLRAVRQQGYATTVEEMTLGACSIGVPVRVAGEVVAALGVVVPDLGRNRGKLVAAAQVAAAGIGRVVGEMEDLAAPGQP